MGMERYGGVNSYKEFMKIGNHRILSREEERQLAKSAHGGDKEAKDQLTLCNSRFVIDYVHANYDITDIDTKFDLIQSGLVGMMLAIPKFNEESGNRFITYAKFWVIKEIEECLRTKYRVCYTSYALTTINKFNKARREMEEKGKFSLVELANKLNWSLERTTEIYYMSVLHEEVSYDKTIYSPDDNGEVILLDKFCSEIGIPEEETLENDRNELVRELLDSLSEQKRRVIQLYYFEGTKYAQIAGILGLSTATVESLARKAKNEMKCILALKNLTTLDMVV